MDCGHVGQLGKGGGCEICGSQAVADQLFASDEALPGPEEKAKAAAVGTEGEKFESDSVPLPKGARTNGNSQVDVG
jgi:hypothetical protein